MEAFQPIPVWPASENRLLFFVRCCADLQLLTVFRFLRPRLARLQGKVLDVGAGESPWRELMRGVDYVGLDTIDANTFGMSRRQDIVYYDGGRLPFDDETFDHVLCTEVLEHVASPRLFLADLHRVLRPGGTLVLTVPWSARIHHVPNDYHRFTRYGLERALIETGFSPAEIEERGSDIAAIANKLLVWCIRLLRPRPWVRCIYTWPAALALSPFVALFLLAAHVALALGWGSRDDPLGYGATASKPVKRNVSSTTASAI